LLHKTFGKRGVELEYLRRDVVFGPMRIAEMHEEHDGRKAGILIT
jgi:hypothetical protein